MWGDSSSGQCGVGRKEDVPSPELVSFTIQEDKCKHGVPLSEEKIHIRKVACGHTHTLAITNRGELWAWGSGMGLGLQDKKESLVPERVQELSDSNVLDIACGMAHSLALVEKHGHVNTPRKSISDMKYHKFYPPTCAKCNQEIYSYIETNDLCIISDEHTCSKKVDKKSPPKTNEETKSEQTSSVTSSPLKSEQVSSVTSSPLKSEPISSVASSPLKSEPISSVASSPLKSEPISSVASSPLKSEPLSSVASSPLKSEPISSVTSSSLKSELVSSTASSSLKEHTSSKTSSPVKSVTSSSLKSDSLSSATSSSLTSTSVTSSSVKSEQTSSTTCSSSKDEQSSSTTSSSFKNKETTSSASCSSQNNSASNMTSTPSKSEETSCSVSSPSKNEQVSSVTSKNEQVSSVASKNEVKLTKSSSPSEREQTQAIIPSPSKETVNISCNQSTPQPSKPTQLSKENSDISKDSSLPLKEGSPKKSSLSPKKTATKNDTSPSVPDSSSTCIKEIPVAATDSNQSAILSPSPTITKLSDNQTDSISSKDEGDTISQDQSCSQSSHMSTSSTTEDIVQKNKSHILDEEEAREYLAKQMNDQEGNGGDSSCQHPIKTRLENLFTSVPETSVAVVQQVTDLTNRAISTFRSSVGSMADSFGFVSGQHIELDGLSKSSSLDSNLQSDTDSPSMSRRDSVFTYDSPLSEDIWRRRSGSNDDALSDRTDSHSSLRALWRRSKKLEKERQSHKKDDKSKFIWISINKLIN